MKFYRCTRCGSWLMPWVCTPCLLCRVRFWAWLRLRAPGKEDDRGE